MGRLKENFDHANDVKEKLNKKAFYDGVILGESKTLPHRFNSPELEESCAHGDVISLGPRILKVSPERISQGHVTSTQTREKQKVARNNIFVLPHGGKIGDQWQVARNKKNS